MYLVCSALVQGNLAHATSLRAGAPPRAMNLFCYVSGSKPRPGPREVAAGRLADRPLRHSTCHESRFTVWQGTLMSCQGTIKSPNAPPPSRKLNFRLVWMPLLPLPQRSNVEVQANTFPLPAYRSTLYSRGKGGRPSLKLSFLEA